MIDKYMKQQEIHSVTLDRQVGSGTSCLMEGEVRGTRVTHYAIKAGESLCLPECTDFVRILFVYQGTAVFSKGTDEILLNERDIYIADPQKAVVITATTSANVLEISRYLSDDEFLGVCSHADSLPYVVVYDKAPTYTEDCKSPKTISRMLVPTRIIPRFAMGSVETRGDDLIEQHEHPMLEQFFFGLDDNDCDALIDDIVFPFHRNTLLHIPLGSNHGVRSRGNQVVHYLWMDFLFDDEGLAYMDSVHKLSEGTGSAE